MSWTSQMSSRLPTIIQRRPSSLSTKVIKLVDSFVADVTGYNRYKQEEAYGEFVRKYTKELRQLDDYFNDADPKLVLDLIDDKMCEVLRKPEPDPHTIKSQTSEEKIPTEQFCFIMRQPVHPLIQLQIPPQLASPANWNFAKECLTEEETLEEGANQMLPQPFHSKLAEVGGKHPTRCVAAAVHWLLCKAAFKTNISQSKVAEKFMVQPKKLHITITGHKYDMGRKLTKKEKAEQVAATNTTPLKPKVAKQDTMKDP